MGSTRAGSLTARCNCRAYEVLVLSVTDARLLLGANCPITDNEILTMLLQFRQIACIALDAVDSEPLGSTEVES